jgi:hypothetical protein
MHKSAPVSFEDLLVAYEWVSAAGPFENEAFVSRATGKIHWSSSVGDVEEELPEDIEDGSLYVAVPHKNDFNLGRDLAFCFADEHVPDSYELVRQFFRKRGAHSQFKSLLERKGRLENWYKYEESAVEAALREWGEENGLQLKSQPLQTGS